MGERTTAPAARIYKPKNNTQNPFKIMACHSHTPPPHARLKLPIAASALPSECCAMARFACSRASSGTGITLELDYTPPTPRTAHLTTQQAPA